MKGVFRAPTPPPSEVELHSRQGKPPQNLDALLEKVAFPASREDLLHSLLGYRVLTPVGEVPGDQLARGLRERVYRSLEQLQGEVGYGLG